jgi:predicted dehydrogenase
MSLLQTAVVGLGVGEQHARAFAADPRTQLRLLCDTDERKARELAELLGVGEVRTRFEDVLADAATHIVSIATFDDQHAGQVEAALAAGKHVFCEKPLCRTLDEARRIREAQGRRRHLRVGCNLVLRGAPLYQWLRERIRAGYFGRVYAVDGDYLYGRLPKITEGWRAKVEDYSVFEGGGVHLVDLLIWLLGERPTHVTASGNRIATEGTSFRYDDFVAATFDLPSGCIARVSANFASVTRHQHVLRVFGTERTFLYDDQGARVYEERDPGGLALRIDHAPLPPSKGVLIPDFVSDVLAATSTSLDDDLAVVAVCHAAELARTSHQRTRIEYA